MRWSRLLLLGLASAYPLYWTAQFLLFFVPETLVAFWLGQPIRVISVSYLQAMAEVYPRAAFAAHWEALIFALVLAAAIVGMDADRFLTGALAVVALGQAALLPSLSLTLSGAVSLTTICAGILAFALVVFGLYRTLQRIGGQVFLDRLAFLSLLTVLPQAMLWLVFKFAYPFFDVRFLLLRIIPLYLAAIVASAIPANMSEPVFNGVRWIEIIASSAAASLLIIAITLGDHSFNAKDRQQAPGPSPTSQIIRPSFPPLSPPPANALPYLPMQC